MNTKEKWVYCLHALESIRELSSPVSNAGKVPFPEMAMEERMEFINDLISGTIELLDDVSGSAGTGSPLHPAA